ncbi:M3 family metallopeptidase [Zoogloea sp.]|uniref:M3 family metallopeptidase n=1 Tax=Zoogloea sp. TaxID=49181 RepID=UPI001B5F22B7|nr:M3 family metallopeptidase [Zoogloea sp.]MBP8133210.1 M3 family metallopeptidase [Zoogloea sp.]MDD2669769.1 M3 family metallopeptidase [Zoogloea sp.]
MTTTPATSPLLELSGLPRFDTILPAHVEPAVRSLLDALHSTIERLQDDPTPPTWANFVEPIENESERVGRAWGVAAHMHSVMDTPEWREAYNTMLPEVTRFYAELGQNLKLFEKYKAIRNGAEFATLSPARQRIIDNELRGFRLSGAELSDEQKPRFQAIQEELASLGAKFSENVLDATNAFAHVVTDQAELAGLPDDVIAAARESAEKAGVEGWKFGLKMPSYLPVMQYADSRSLRETFYRAYSTRAAEIDNGFSKPEWDNGPLIGKLLALRTEEAKMLGYNNYAEVSLVPKMADSTDQVLGFLRELAVKAKPFAEKDLAELQAFAKDELGLDTLQPWDVTYVSEKLRVARYAFSEQEVKEYLPEHKVLQGLFGVVEKLYQINIKPDSGPVWHPDVRFFRIERDGELIGQFYLDLYARDTKKGGAWMDSAITRRRIPDGIETPVAYLVCNFPGPVGGKPATFSHDDAITLFHEAGHGLHHLLTRIDDLAVSGIHGVEWDAVELPSQFMENFCWEWDVVCEMTAHAETGEPLPKELFDKMLAAKNFQSGMGTVRQLEFSLFDLLLHMDFDPARQSYMDLLAEVRKEVAVLVPPAWHRFPNSFSHIFAGGYSAGYYSYKWAEVLSADAFAAFEEAAGPAGSVLHAETGERFWNEILAVGGSRPALESFKAFRGREPQVDALLRHSGMVSA